MEQLEELAARHFGTVPDGAVMLSCVNGSMSKVMSVSVNWQLTSGFHKGPPATKCALDECIWSV